ncbi:hypothetical protein DSO57_1031293 [Entomophthora muscae]|uniref:Uncharacterized protein n=1 Tax=Entomophthora muscae TaxID=34485 RepID=A0ACC2RRL6_9FUNG|nr:hypothetical protein DSO57_1031293 [Entomophthora muscae]
MPASSSDLPTNHTGKLFGDVYITLTRVIDTITPAAGLWSWVGKSFSYLFKLAPLLWWALPAKNLACKETPGEDTASGGEATPPGTAGTDPKRPTEKAAGEPSKQAAKNKAQEKAKGHQTPNPTQKGRRKAEQKPRDRELNAQNEMAPNADEKAEARNRSPARLVWRLALGAETASGEQQTTERRAKQHKGPPPKKAPDRDNKTPENNKELILYHTTDAYSKDQENTPVYCNPCVSPADLETVRL